MMPFLLAQAIAGSTFDPQTQGSLVAWYDLSTLGLSNGASIASFPDSKTGNPYPMTRASGSTSVYATAQQNGLGAGSWPSINYFTGGPDASTYPMTLVAVIKPTSSGVRTFLGPSSAGATQFRVENSPQYLGIVKADAAYIGASTTAVSAGYHLVVCTLAASSYAFYIDGVAVGSGTNSVTMTAGITFNVGSKQIGNENYVGYIGEIQIYNTILSSGDLSALHTYIVNKWATP